MAPTMGCLLGDAEHKLPIDPFFIPSEIIQLVFNYPAANFPSAALTLSPLSQPAVLNQFLPLCFL